MGMIVIMEDCVGVGNRNIVMIRQVLKVGRALEGLEHQITLIFIIKKRHKVSRTRDNTVICLQFLGPCDLRMASVDVRSRSEDKTPASTRLIIDYQLHQSITSSWHKIVRVEFVAADHLDPIISMVYFRERLQRCSRQNIKLLRNVTECLLQRHAHTTSSRYSVP